MIWYQAGRLILTFSTKSMGVLVPGAVLIELQHADAPSEVRAWSSAPPAWLEERQVQQIEGSLAAELGAGEREAISLALEAKTDVLLVDERAA